MVRSADLLTLSRVVLTPVVAVLWFGHAAQWRWVGVVLFVIAALTDIADGRLARRLNQTSRFGSYVDPLADKLLVLVTGVVLVYDHRLAVWWLALVVSRELAVTTLRSVLKPGTNMGASRTAKWKTLTQLFAVGAAAVFSGPMVLALIVLSGAMTAWSGGEYVVRFWKAIDI